MQIRLMRTSVLLLIVGCDDTPTNVPTMPSTSGRAAPALAVVASPEPAPAVIHACANKASGILKIVAAGQECGPSENALAWNVAGPPGPPGPPGASGLANVQAYSEQGTGSSVRVFCPAGTIVVGGGAVSHTPSLALIQSFPITATGENANGPFLAGWQAAPVDWAGPVQAFVLCASP